MACRSGIPTRSPTRRRSNISAISTSLRADTDTGGERATTVHALYTRALAERGFREDPSQLAAVAKLDDLRKRLLAAHDASRSVGARAARKLLRVPTLSAPRGIYLWGGVGRGKTWLMDLFYQSLSFPERRRRHF